MTGTGASQRLFRSGLALVFIMVEIAAGAFLYYFVIYIERHLGGMSGPVESSDPILYWFAYVGKILLLGADGLIILFFVGHGVFNAYKQIWREG